jgi:hypothetical protein
MKPDNIPNSSLYELYGLMAQHVSVHLGHHQVLFYNVNGCVTLKQLMLPQPALWIHNVAGTFFFFNLKIKTVLKYDGIIFHVIN